MKKPWLAGLYRGLRYPLIRIIINHDKDPYSTTRIQWKVMPNFFRGSLEFISYILLKKTCVWMLVFWQVNPPFNGKWWYIPNKPINTHKVYMGLIINFPPSHGAFPTVFPMIKVAQVTWRGTALNHLQEANMERLMPQPAPGVAAYRREREFLQDRKWRFTLWFFQFGNMFGFFFRKSYFGGHFYRKSFLGGGNSNMFYFHPNLEKMIQFDEHIFQMGWNHQLEKNGGLWNSLGFP